MCGMHVRGRRFRHVRWQSIDTGQILPTSSGTNEKATLYERQSNYAVVMVARSAAAVTMPVVLEQTRIVFVVPVITGVV